MRIKTTLFVLALAGATVIGVSLTTQKAQALPIDHLTAAVQAGMLAKPPSGGGKSTSSNKSSSNVKNTKSFTKSYPGNHSWYGNHYYGGFGWYNHYNCFGCYDCYSPYSCYGWYNCCPDSVPVYSSYAPPPVDIEVYYKKTVK
jgi:hypothetical protein